MFCMQCGAKLRDDAKFCAACGAPVTPRAGVSEKKPAESDSVAASAPAATEQQEAISEPDLISELLVRPEEQAEPETPARPEPESPSASSAVQKTVAMPAPAPAGAYETAEAPSSDREALDSHKRKKRMRAGAKVAIGIALVAVLAAGGGAGYYFGIYKPERERLAQEAYDAAHSLHAVTIAVKAEGWDTAGGATRLPVHVVGADLDGNDVDAVQYVDSAGAGISLIQGSYELTVPASPIAENGTIYTVPDATVEVSIDSDAKKDQSYDISTDHGFELVPTDPAQVTDDQINNAYEYASKDEEQDSSALDSLKDAATAKRDEAVAAAARHVVIDNGKYKYSFDLPAAWDGRVKVVTGDGGNDVEVVSSKYPDLVVFSMNVIGQGDGDWGDGGNPFDFINVAMPSHAMKAGMTVYEYGNALAMKEYVDKNGDRGIDAFDYQFFKDIPTLSAEERDEIVYLQSGGQHTYADYQSAAEDGNVRGSLYKSAHEYLQNAIISTIQMGS